MRKVFLFAISFLWATTSLAEWQYIEKKDGMRGTTNRWAVLQSDNTADVGSYRSEMARLRLDIRSMPKLYGTDVILSIPKGQIQCSYDGCKIPMKFDDGPIINYTATRGDSRHDTIFIEEKAGFIRRAKKASRIIIEIPIWRRGNQQFVFSPAGLVWE